MLSLNRKLLIFCANRRKILQSFVSDVARLDRANFFASSVLLEDKKFKNISQLVTPVNVKHEPENLAVGKEIVGNLDKTKLLKVINKFYRSPKFRRLAEENNLDETLLANGFSAFRTYCLKKSSLPPDLYIILSDLIQGHGNILDIFPFFLRYIKEMFPHLDYMDDLKKIGDVRQPAAWYPEARAIKRKFIFHCGPTNSGKTYQAVQRFLQSKSGVYCGPLKLLAVEIFNKSNESGTPCDLVTGEEIIHVKPDGDQSSHVSCTIEMVSFEKEYEVAIIDEIQMIRDMGRGWAWTRALLGLRAKEIHICGEEAAVDIVDSILCTTNEEFEVKKYERLTKLTVVDSPNSLSNIRPGDCIVCFTKSDIYKLSRNLENLHVETAVIYGSLPPGAKLAQCKKFNDPKSQCKVLVATDAIGMGLNLSIRRIIFYSLIKPKINEAGTLEMDHVSVSQAFQIGGRAGRFGSCFEEGEVTTFYEKDLPILKTLFSKTPETVLNAGLLPTVEQIEMYSYYLPGSSLCNLVQIFMQLSTIDDSIYFMCDMSNFLFLAQKIEHITLPVRIQFTFCCAPLDKKLQFPITMFVKFANHYSNNKVITYSWLSKCIGWPLEEPKSIQDLNKTEEIYEVLDLYLWLSNRYPQYFPDAALVKTMQQEVDKTILKCVVNLNKCLKLEQEMLSETKNVKGG